jgi:hypothetical protein
MIEALITALVTGAAMAFFIWLSNRNTDVTACYLGWGWRIVYTIFALLSLSTFILLSFLSFFEAEFKSNMFIIILCFFGSLLFGYFAIDGFIREIRWNEYEVTFKGLLKKERSVMWKDVVAIEHLAMIQAEALRFRDGSKVAFSEIMVGSRALKLACFEYGSLDE